MKRSRRVVLTMMGSAAVSVASVGLAQARHCGPGREVVPGPMDDPIAARSIAASAARRIISMRMATAMAMAADYQFMQRIACPERDDWRLTAAACGFDFHTIDGERYWDERAHYAFTLEEIEHGIEAPTAEIDAMCLELVGRAVGDETYLRRLKIPEAFWPLIRDSWHSRRGQPLRPAGPRFRRTWTGETARIQCRHADLDLRGRGLPVDLARAGDRAEHRSRQIATSSTRSTNA